MIEQDDVAVIGLGTWVLGEGGWKGDTDPHGAIEASVENGINLLDTAPVYGAGRSEQRVGKVLDELGCREDVFLATKCGLQWNPDDEDQVWRNSRPDRLRQEIQDSLERLRTDYIDLYQVHWPDTDVPFDETIDLLEEFRSQGLIRYIGLSNFSVDQIKQAQKGGTIDWLQPPYNLFERKTEHELLPFCQREGIRTLIYSAICRGLLAGKYESPDDIQLEEGDVRLNDVKFTDRADEYIEAVNRIKRYLKDRGHTEPLAALMLRWTVEQPGVTCALVGARNRDQAETNARALGVSLSPEEIDRVREIADEVIRKPVEPEWMAPPLMSEVA